MVSRCDWLLGKLLRGNQIWHTTPFNTRAHTFPLTLWDGVTLIRRCPSPRPALLISSTQPGFSLRTGMHAPVSCLCAHLLGLCCCLPLCYARDATSVWWLPEHSEKHKHGGWRGALPVDCGKECSMPVFLVFSILRLFLWSLHPPNPSVIFPSLCCC